MRATTVLIIASFIIPNFAVPVSVGDGVTQIEKLAKVAEVEHTHSRDLLERAPIIEAIPVEVRSEPTVEEDEEDEEDDETSSVSLEEDSFEDDIDTTTYNAGDESEKRAVRPGSGTRISRAVRPGSGTRISRAVRPGSGTRISRAVRPGSGTHITRAVRPGGGISGKRSFIERAYSAFFG